MGVGDAVGVGIAGTGAGAVTVGAGVAGGNLRKDTAGAGFGVRPSVAARSLLKRR